MRAAILSIGDELTLGQSLDTNATWLSARLAEMSILTVERRTVGDDQAAIARAVRELGETVDVLISTGGLGPTDDDLTREGLGEVLAPGEPLVRDAEAERQIEQMFRSRGRAMPAMNVKQAMRPATMRFLPNPRGTAPGLAGEFRSARGVCLIFALPGPPGEMQPMFLAHVAPKLQQTTGSVEAMLTGVVQEFGMGESEAAERLGSMMQRDRQPLVGTTASEAIVSARIRIVGRHEQAARQLEQTIEAIERAWWPYAFGRGETTLAQSVGDLLRQRGRTLATAESCTGGWLGKAIVDVAGSSEYYLGGWITYSNEMKVNCLGVPAETIASFGAVSEPTARALAEGAALASGADFALSITGIAGPGGGTPTKRVGTVFIALAQRDGNRVMSTTVRHFVFPGDRTAVRDRSVKAALQMLRFALLDVPPNLPLLWEVLADQPNAEQGLQQEPSEATTR